MTKTIILFALLFAGNWIFAQITDIPFYKNDFLGIPEKLCLHKAVTVEDESYSSWDLTYNRLLFELNPEKLFIKGSVYFEFKSKSSLLQTVIIDLASNMQIKTISSGNNSLNFTRNADKVTISLQKGLVKNENGNFTVVFEGEPIGSGYGSFVQNFHGDKIPALSTLSEPYGAKDWWPCKQSLSDKIDSIDVIVKSPSDYTTASNGLLMENSITDGVRTCIWKHRYPIATYLIFVSTTQYAIYSDWATMADGQKLEILNYVYPSSYDEAQKITPITSHLIELYSQLFIDYPFKNEKYGHAQFPWGGGMEHQTMTSLGIFNAPLIAHELAHQWFGDYITCSNWHEIWLNEGFATFLTGLYYQNLDPDNWVNWKKTVIQRVLAEPGGSVYVEDTTDIRRIFDSRLSYNKGAYVLQMLRGQIGDSLFFSGLKNYLNDQRVSNGFATTAIFREIMETTADTSLTEFFNDWIYGEGYPVYQIDCTVKNQQLTIDISQTPSLKNGPFFEMNIPISIYRNEQRHILWVPNHSANDHLSYSLTFKPDSLIINEDLWLLGKLTKSINTVPAYPENEISLYVDQQSKTLFLNLPSNTECQFKIYKTNGQLTETGKTKGFQQTVVLNNYIKGIYLVQIINSNKVLSGKFVVE